MKRRNTYVYNPSFAHSGLAKGRISDSDREIEDHRGPVARVESANVDLGGMGAPPRSRSLDLVPNNNWVHIALTVEVATADNGATATLYVNGAAQGPSFTGPVNENVPYGDGSFVLGSAVEWARTAGYRRGFNGLIDEVDLFGRALSADDVLGGPRGGGPPFCVAPRLARHHRRTTRTGVPTPEEHRDGTHAP